MSAAPDSRYQPRLRGDLAGMTEALAQFAQREFPQARTAQPRIAVLVPCFNEEAAIATVVADFRKALPAAEIYVYDNNSSDRTVAVAREAGAQVRSERRQARACGAADVRRHRCRHLSVGRWRCHLRRRQRAADDRDAEVGPS